MAEGDNPGPGRDTGALSDAYEQLRDAVLAGGAGGWRLGHGLLSARGMTSWISAVSDLAPSASRATGEAGVAPGFASSGHERASAARSVSPPAVDRVVAVLTQMVLPLAA